MLYIMLLISQDIQITRGEYLAHGAFGELYEGSYEKSMFALKFPKKHPDVRFTNCFAVLFIFPAAFPPRNRHVMPFASNRPTS